MGVVAPLLRKGGGAECVRAAGDQFQPSRESLCQDTGDKNQISDSRGAVWI